MRTTALRALRHPSLAMDDSIRADITFTDRLIPNVERRLVSTCILWPEIREKVMGLKIDRRHKKHALKNGVL